MLKGWRTVILNAIAGLVALLDVLLPAVMQVLSLPEITGVLPPGWLPYWALGVAMMNIYLRSITDTPVGQK